MSDDKRRALPPPSQTAAPDGRRVTDVKNVAVDPKSLRRAPPPGWDEGADDDSLFKDASGRPVQAPPQRVSRPGGRLQADPCPHFDAQKQHCGYMGISARPIGTADGKLACCRQAHNWQGRTLPCKIPEIIAAQSFKGEFYLHSALRASATTVLNAIALEDRCPHSKASEKGPLCNTMAVNCVRPEGHHECRVYLALEAVGGVIRGQQEKAIVQRAYDQELAEIDGKLIDRSNSNRT
jgi:hypothetical protein